MKEINKITVSGTTYTIADAAAQEAADNAQSAADNAKTAADNAQSAADNAKTAADNAQTAADNAQTTAADAQAAAENAQAAADKNAADITELKENNYIVELKDTVTENTAAGYETHDFKETNHDGTENAVSNFVLAGKQITKLETDPDAATLVVSTVDQTGAEASVTLPVLQSAEWIPFIDPTKTQDEDETTSITLESDSFVQYVVYTSESTDYAPKVNGVEVAVKTGTTEDGLLEEFSLFLRAGSVLTFAYPITKRNLKIFKLN